MRIFWAVIAVLLLATVGIVLASGLGSGGGSVGPEHAEDGVTGTVPGGRGSDAGDVVALDSQSTSDPVDPPAPSTDPIVPATSETEAFDTPAPAVAEDDGRAALDQPSDGSTVNEPLPGAPAATAPAGEGQRETPTSDPAMTGTTAAAPQAAPGPATHAAPALAPATSPEGTESPSTAPASTESPEAEPASTAGPEAGGEAAPEQAQGAPVAPGEAVTTNAPAPPPPTPALPPDAAATRSAMGLLTTVMNQSQIAPGADLIGRLAAAASGYWSAAPEVQAAVPGSARAFRITSPTAGGPVFVADNGAGNDVTIIIPRADPELVHTMLQAVVQLSLAPPDDGGGEPGGPAADPGMERYGVTLNGEPAGLLMITPVRTGPGAGGIAIFFHATTPVPLEAASVGAAADVSYEVQEDGSIKLSNGTVIQGAGTPEKPYAVTWDLLVSAERVYQPRNGLTTMPKWCDALHLKHVRITGHLLSPLMMDDTTQILLMRNQWDGCCVGVPPTPYDAIEVELSRPVSLVREQLNYGTITGVLEVDPYLVNNWLVGLWIVSEAKIENSGAQNWAVPVAPN